MPAPILVGRDTAKLAPLAALHPGGRTFPWGLLEGAKGVQLAELGLVRWEKRAWVGVPKLAGLPRLTLPAGCGAIGGTRAMPSSFPPDETPTIASPPVRSSSPEEGATIARNPSRSLWEAGLAGHREALGQILGRCAQAVYAWMRSHGSEPAVAAARTGNFLRWVEMVKRPDVQGEDVNRLQDFLLRRLTDYLAEGFPEAASGEGAMLPVFDQAQAERRFLREAARTPDDVFTRRWALGALELTIETLSEEFASDGRGALVPHLRQFLSFSGGEELYGQVSEQTGASVSALHVAVFKFRQRYREILRRLVGDTVRHEEDVDSELTKLLVSAS